jgi:choline dehydrogenase-like flavoprotein
VSGEHDFDWLVIGSGFGGSVSALRLAEKGYRVAVLESGRRYEDEDFAETIWNARRYCWLPRLGLKGIFRMTLFKDVFVVSGCGVGGGSPGYANTLYRPQPGSAFYRDPQWSKLEDWETVLAPHFDTAVAPAWSAAATTPRTRWSRTTCGSPSATACRYCRSAPSPRSGHSAHPTARTATRSPATAPGHGFARAARS